jgi:hypothetical protein
VAKQYGIEYPERPLMAVLSDLLAIPHFTTSNGGTVRSDFLQAVLVALGGDPSGLDKDRLIEACVHAATGSFDRDLLSPGGTVTNEALQRIIDGVNARRARPEPEQPVLDPAWADPVEYDPDETADLRRWALSERAVREGQDKFRTAVLTAYSRACAITGADAPGALEAAHITPYRGPASNVVPNGLALRADLHRLWDGGQLAIDARTGLVLVSHALRPTTYGQLHGTTPANMPRLKTDRPSAMALTAHQSWTGLAL